MKYFKGIIAFLILCTISYGQTLKINSVTSKTANTKITVPVEATGMPNVSAISLNIKYDISVMKFDSISNTFNGMSYLYYDNSGSIRFSWFSMTSENLSNAKLFDLYFSYKSGESVIEFVPSVCSITEPSLYSYNVIYTNGSVKGNFSAVEENDISPEKYYLTQNYPNPFNPSTQIDFNLPIGGLTSVKVCNINGEEVAQLIDTYLTSGQHKISFNGTGLASGVYLYKITSGNFTQTKKMQLIK